MRAKCRLNGVMYIVIYNLPGFTSDGQFLSVVRRCWMLWASIQQQIAGLHVK